MTTHREAKYTRDALTHWANEPRYNQVFVYHESVFDDEAALADAKAQASYQTQRDALFRTARKLSNAGLVLLFQRRHPQGWWQYCAKRTRIADHFVLDKVSRSIRVGATSDCKTEYAEQEDA